MSERWDVCVPEKSTDGSRTYWTKVGVMFRRDKGGFVIRMAYPAGELYAFPPRDRDEDQGGRRSEPEQRRSERGADDEPPPRNAHDEPAEDGEYDDIPF